MIMLFLMSYSLLCRSTNDPPRHPRRLWTAPTPWRISNLSGVGVALGEVLVSQVFNKPYWGHRDKAGSSDSSARPPSDTSHPMPAPSPLWPLPHVPQTITHHPFSFFLLFTLSSADLCSFLPPFPSTLLPLPPPSKRLFALHSACLPSTHARTPGAPVTQRGFHLKELLRTSL